MKDWYGDNDRTAAAWLRELVKDGLIPEGEVDERSIADLRPENLAGFRRVHHFAGIGGWAYAFELAGWPRERPVWSGSCPCQPFSAAGKRKGAADERHLWPVFFRLIRECRPATIFGEQVASDDGYRWLARVRDDLETAGYAVGCADLPACCEGAPIIRQRLWFVASAGGQGTGRDTGAALGTEAGRGRSRGANGVRGGNDALTRRPTRGMASSGFAPSGRHARPGSDSTQAVVIQDEWLGETTVKFAGSRPLGTVGSARRNRRKQGAAGSPRPESHAGRAGACFWDGYDQVLCTDGKTRRFEPGSFPLAPRIPGRVAMLRGYGNSIVPEVAAKFIRAYLEAEAEAA